jgi:hypothetical protein
MQAREDYKAGLSSLQDYFGELGQDWEEQVRQIAKEREFIASIGTVTPQTDVAAPVEVVKEAPAIDEPTPVNPEKDPNAGPDAELAAKPEETIKSESFIMRDDPDFNLSSKELDMVAKAVGLKDKKPKTTKRK